MTNEIEREEMIIALLRLLEHASTEDIHTVYIFTLYLV